jgi:hypothetical protein
LGLLRYSSFIGPEPISIDACLRARAMIAEGNGAL